MSSSSQSRSRAQLPVAWPRFLKGLHRRGLRKGLRKGLGKGLRVLCCPRRPGSDTTLTYGNKTHHCRERNQMSLIPIKSKYCSIAWLYLSVIELHCSQVKLSPLKKLYLDTGSYHSNTQCIQMNDKEEEKNGKTSSNVDLLMLNMHPLICMCDVFFNWYPGECFFFYVSTFFSPSVHQCCQTDQRHVPSSDWPVPSASWRRQRTSRSIAEEAPQYPVLTTPGWTERIKHVKTVSEFTREQGVMIMPFPKTLAVVHLWKCM